MKHYLRYSGLTALYSGVVLLLAGYAFGWTNYNIFIISASALVVAGLIVHVYFLKRESKY